MTDIRRTFTLAAFVAALLVPSLTVQPAWSANVKITPLGSHAGEMCRRDRAILFEDPDGTTLLYDVGQTVAGANDPRLPKTLNVVLISSVHGDHVGSRRIAKPGAGTCAKPKTSVKTVPNSNSVEIAVGKKSKILGAGQMRAYLTARFINAGADKKTAKKSVKRLRPGGKMKFGGVTVAAIQTAHANGISPSFILDKDLAKALKKSGLTAYAGPDSGFILKFSNGLTVYLSADTGHHADMETIVRRYYKADIAIMNMSDVNTMGPEEAAWAVNELIKPKVAMPSHANEQSTKGGKLVPGSRAEKFVKGVDRSIKVHLTLSGRTMEFDGKAKCVKGC